MQSGNILSKHCRGCYLEFGNIPIKHCLGCYLEIYLLSIVSDDIYKDTY